MLHSEYHNHNPKIKQTRQFFPSPEQFDFWGYVSIAYHPRNLGVWLDIGVLVPYKINLTVEILDNKPIMPYFVFKYIVHICHFRFSALCDDNQGVCERLPSSESAGRNVRQTHSGQRGKMMSCPSQEGERERLLASARYFNLLCVCLIRFLFLCTSLKKKIIVFVL